MAPGRIPPARPILLVEDNRDDAELTLRALRKAHIANPVDIVGDGELALHYLRVRQSHLSRLEFPVLLLLDLKLPKLSGYEILHRLDADGTLKKLPVIVVTSSKRQEDLLEGYRLGVRSFLRKPVDDRKLGGAVAKTGVHWLLLDGNPVRS